MQSVAQLLGAKSANEPHGMSRIARSRLRESSPSLFIDGDLITSNNPDAASYNPPDPVPCEYCGAMRYTDGRYMLGRILWNFSGPNRCKCPEAVAAYEAETAQREAEERAAKEAEEAKKMRERVQRLLGESGMNARFLQRTFDAYIQTPENRTALRICRQYADTFRDKLPRNNPNPGRNGLFITGPMGTGKTHLAAAISNQLMREGTPVICMTMIDLLDRIKRTYEERRQYGDESEGDILDAYKDVPLLVIDDMGKEPATPWAVSKIYAIINARYEAYMPTIVTTNYTDEELVGRLTAKDGDETTAAATVDRLREMCAGIMTTGESWRGK